MSSPSLDLLHHSVFLVLVPCLPGIVDLVMLVSFFFFFPDNLISKASPQMYYVLHSHRFVIGLTMSKVITFVIG